MKSLRDYCRCALLQALCALPLLCAATATKGIGLEIKDSQGHKVGGYDGSYALLIGVSDYTAGWKSLKSIPGELDKVEAMLRRQGFVVQKSLDPNGETLERTIGDFIKHYGYEKGNRLLFYYSGHGYTRDNGAKGYLVPTDAPNPQKDEKGFLRKALDMNQILAWSRQMESKHALFLFDSCFSGTIFKQRALPKEPHNISTLTAEPVREFIIACSAGEEVPAKSTFTPAFIDGIEHGLADVNQDGYVSGTELGLYLRSEVPKHAHENPQFGKISDYALSRGDFVFQVTQGSAVEELPTGSATVSGSLTRKAVAAAPTVAAGATFRDCADCPEMVRLPGQNFAMGKYEVTQGQWRAIMGSNPSDFKNCGNDCPVERVSWNDAQNYIEKLNQRTGQHYRLPSGQEWEAACLAGKRTVYCGSNNFDEVAWYADNSGFTTHPVGRKRPNAWGLYDMSGNVWEWTSNVGELTSDCSDGDCDRRLGRGGSWYDFPRYVRAAARHWTTPDDRYDGLGFRLARNY